jgi:Helix-turn-helix domain
MKRARAEPNPADLPTYRPDMRSLRRRKALPGELQMFKAQFFRALAHPTRIRILEILVRGGRMVQELQQNSRSTSRSCRSS